MRSLLAKLGNPQDSLPIIHVAGTKGKGSTSAMIASILSTAGYRTGLFTSPHLERVEERIVFDGRQCSETEFTALIETVRPVVEELDRAAAGGNFEEIGPTYFEILTAMALLYFKRKNATAVVLEVGLGGRLDSTNVCLPKVSVITSISFDHTLQLGNTLTGHRPGKRRNHQARRAGRQRRYRRGAARRRFAASPKRIRFAAYRSRHGFSLSNIRRHSISNRNHIAGIIESRHVAGNVPAPVEEVSS